MYSGSVEGTKLQPDNIKRLFYRLFCEAVKLSLPLRVENIMEVLEKKALE
jgi:hypothetical protein